MTSKPLYRLRVDDEAFSFVGTQETDSLLALRKLYERTKAHLKAQERDACIKVFCVNEDGAETVISDLFATTPGPPKQFPVQMNLRISDVEQSALGRIAEKTGEDRSEIIRRLIREAVKD